MAGSKFPSTVGVALAGAALALTACASEEKTGTTTPQGGGGTNAAQSVQATSGDVCTPEKYAGGVEKRDFKSLVVGFSQSEKEANPFRIAETQSMKDEAQKRGIKLIVTNAQGDLNRQISDIQSLLSQGAQAIVIAPLKSEGLDPALEAAKTKKVPVLTIDRLLSSKKACTDYLSFIGSDFKKQGERAADAMNKATGGKGKLVILKGLTGVNVTDDRNSGFTEQIEKVGAGIEIVAQQPADFDRQKGRTVTQQLLQAHPDLSAIYAHNDEMALGAVAALKAAGKKPGDVKIVTIDGTKGAVQGLVDGWISGVIESNPRFGPLAFSSLEGFYGGKGVPAQQIIGDKEYTPENAKAELANAY